MILTFEWYNIPESFLLRRGSFSWKRWQNGWSARTEMKETSAEERAPCSIPRVIWSIGRDGHFDPVYIYVLASYDFILFVSFLPKFWLGYNSNDKIDNDWYIAEDTPRSRILLSCSDRHTSRSGIGRQVVKLDNSTWSSFLFLFFFSIF